LVVGVGSIGERHTRCFLATGRAVAGICESNGERRAAVAEQYAVEGAYEQLDEALAQLWDAVLVATPAHTHIPIATQVAQRGINLLIEKPLSASLEGVDELKALVAGQGLIAAVGYQYRAHPGVRAMKEALDSGRFGKPLQVYGAVGQSFPFYRPAYRDVYFARREHGGGAIQDAITHLLNLAEFLAGPITRLAVDAGHQSLEGVTVEDTVHVIARHGDVMANYALNLYQHPNESQITVVCERGTLRFELHQKRWRSMTEPEGPWEDHVYELKDRDSWYVAHADAFLDVLEGKAEALCTLDDGIQTLRVNLAALRSAETLTWQRIES
jgi:predicted dehydrogenase